MLLSPVFVCNLTLPICISLATPGAASSSSFSTTEVTAAGPVSAAPAPKKNYFGLKCGRDTTNDAWQEECMDAGDAGMEPDGVTAWGLSGKALNDHLAKRVSGIESHHLFLAYCHEGGILPSEFGMQAGDPLADVEDWDSWLPSHLVAAVDASGCRDSGKTDLANLLPYLTKQLLQRAFDANPDLQGRPENLPSPMLVGSVCTGTGMSDLALTTATDVVADMCCLPLKTVVKFGQLGRMSFY
jgi:hypothetical protein